MAEAAKKLDWIEETVADLPRLVTTEEAASTLRMSKRTLARNLAEGRIKSVRCGEAGAARRLIPRTAIAEYLRSLDG